MENTADLKAQVQKILSKEITLISLKGKGAVNYAYYIETNDGSKYIVKKERADKEFQPQNDLIIEAKVAEKLSSLKLSVLTPNVVFILEDPKMYGYEYFEGDLMRGVWESLSESERINICYKLGQFHAEIGKKFTKEDAEAVGIKIDMSPDHHPEISIDYKRLIVDNNIPEEFKTLAKEAKSIFDGTKDNLVFQFLHNDSHHENIVIKDKNISGIIDFGQAEYGEIAKEFSRYIRDYPNYFRHIVSSYEEISGNKLSYKRLVSNALVSGFQEIVEDYRKGGKERSKAENDMATYRKLIEEVAS